jgi:hypothetical protein
MEVVGSDGGGRIRSKHIKSSEEKVLSVMVLPDLSSSLSLNRQRCKLSL